MVVDNQILKEVEPEVKEETGLPSRGAGAEALFPPISHVPAHDPAWLREA
jgi:hypothetical protein